VSYITGDTQQLIQIDAMAKLAKDATGASLYGPDLSKWPSREVEALTVLQYEHNRVENARIEAEREE